MRNENCDRKSSCDDYKHNHCDGCGGNKPKGDLISREALKYKNLAEVNGKLTYVLTAEEIDNAPTVDYEKLTVERPQGQWKVRTADDGLIYYQCTVCWKNNFFEAFPFCPYCGARVRTGRLRIRKRGDKNG